MINYYDIVVNDRRYCKRFSVDRELFIDLNSSDAATLTDCTNLNCIYYVLKGTTTICTPGQVVDVSAGQSVFVRRGVPILSIEGAEYYRIIFAFKDSFICEFLSDYGFTRKGGIAKQDIIPIDNDEVTTGCFQSILPYFISADSLPDKIVQLKCKELLLHLLHNSANEMLYSYFATLQQGVKTGLHEIMEANYAANLGVEAYARLANRSVSSFKRDFQNTYNTTPGKWIIQKKLEEARRLLAQTNNSIADIALDSGFENTASFSRLFKQKTGCTPLEYRKNMQ